MDTLWWKVSPRSTSFPHPATCSRRITSLQSQKLALFSTTAASSIRFAFSKAGQSLNRTTCFLVHCRSFSSTYLRPDSMNWSTSVLSTVSADTDPSVIITFDNAKYMFNAGENTIRSFTQSECNKKKMRGVFFTQIGVHRAGGLAGLLMTLADATLINDLNLTGPKGLTHYLASMRLYTYRDNLRLLTNEILPAINTPELSLPAPTPTYKDENITVYALPLYPTPSAVAITDPSNPTLLSAGVPSKRKRDTSPESPRKRSNTSSETSPSSTRTRVDTSVAENPLPLAQLMLQPNFNPETLSEEVAKEWKNFIIRTMFPATPENVQTDQPNVAGKQKGQAAERKGKGKKNEKGKGKVNITAASKSATESASTEATIPADTVNVDDYRRARPRPPSGFYTKLPTPFPQSSSSPSSSEASSQRLHRDPSSHPISYVVVGPRVRGKFDLEQANALGVPRGPLRGKLTKGETITFTVKETGEDGEVNERVVTVRPDQCVGESEAPSVVMVLDVPTPAHIPSLLANFRDSSYFEQFRSDKPEHKKEYTVRALFHLCGEGVLEDGRYVTFMKGFREGVEHIVASRDHSPNPVTFTSAAFNQLRLNQLDSTMFPIPKFRMEPKRQLSSVPNLPPRTQLMATNLKMSIRPVSTPAVDPHALEKDRFHPLLRRGEGVTVTLNEASLKAFEEARKSVKAKEDQEQDMGVEFNNSGGAGKGKDVVIIPLGTGSAVPGKYRSVSSTLIQIPKWGNVLLDAGEGTYYQLTRHFGEEGVKAVIRDLKCLFVSHVHGDHHMGVPMILKKRLELDPPPTQPLYLVTLRSVQLYLRELQELQYLGISDDPDSNDIVTIMSEALHYKRPGVYSTTGYWNVGGNEAWTDAQQSLANASAMCDSLGLKSLRTVDVYHGTKCYGAVLKHNDGWSIVFSGDTEPTENLVYAGRNATLLIHEATMADDQADLAKQKKHSTFGQAISIGKRMNAQNILLTHFSARHPKIPMALMPIPCSPQSRARQKAQPVIALAFDHARLRIGDMWKMQYYLPALQQNFKDTVEDDDEDDDLAMGINMDVGL